MSNSKVFIFLSVYISPIFHRTGETSLSQSQSQSVSHSTSESDSLRGKFSTLRYFGSSRSELIGRTDAKIVLTAPPTIYSPTFLSLTPCFRASGWVSDSRQLRHDSMQLNELLSLFFLVFSWVGVGGEGAGLVWPALGNACVVEARQVQYLTSCMTN